jgi:hypothetical protein
MSLNAMIRAYSKINPGNADNMQRVWVDTLSEASGKSEQAILLELCSPQDPFLRSLQRLEAECADFARSCEGEGTRGHQLAVEAWALDRITASAEKAAFPFAAPLWASRRHDPVRSSRTADVDTPVIPCVDHKRSERHKAAGRRTLNE